MDTDYVYEFHCMKQYNSGAAMMVWLVDITLCNPSGAAMHSQYTVARAFITGAFLPPDSCLAVNRRLP